jgi:hypothetical protein
VPGSAGTSWGKEMSQLSLEKSYYAVDVGYTAIFFYWGFLGLFIYVFLLYKTLKFKLAKQYIYLKIFIIYLYLISFFGTYIYTNGWLLVLTFYVMECLNRKEYSLKRLKKFS